MNLDLEEIGFHIFQSFPDQFVTVTNGAGKVLDDVNITSDSPSRINDEANELIIEYTLSENKLIDGATYISGINLVVAGGPKDYQVEVTMTNSLGVSEIVGPVKPGKLTSALSDALPANLKLVSIKLTTSGGYSFNNALVDVVLDGCYEAKLTTTTPSTTTTTPQCIVRDLMDEGV